MVRFGNGTSPCRDSVTCAVRRNRYMMPNRAMIVGIHNVDAEESVYLIELEIEGDVDAFDFSEVTLRPITNRK